LLLGQKLVMGDKSFAEAWNFGPEREGNRTVSDVLIELSEQWQTMLWHVTDKPQPHEANLLYLDSAKAQSKLGWKPVWDLDTTLKRTADWYRAWLEDSNVISRHQLAAFVKAAARANIEWAVS
jgi:CDP-glucose 4,6-dehydratase